MKIRVLAAVVTAGSLVISSSATAGGKPKKPSTDELVHACYTAKDVERTTEAAYNKALWDRKAGQATDAEVDAAYDAMQAHSFESIQPCAALKVAMEETAEREMYEAHRNYARNPTYDNYRAALQSTEEYVDAKTGK